MSILSRFLREVVAQEFSGIQLPASAAFFPMYSLDLGELSTTAAVEIARITKQRAETIADRIISEMSKLIDATWRNDNGYIVCSSLATPILLSEIQPTVTRAIDVLESESVDSFAKPLSVWCLLPDSTEPVYARMRILARTVIQGLLNVVYCGPTNLSFPPALGRLVRSQSEVLDLFCDGINWILDHEHEDRLEVDLPEDGERSLIWTTHHYHDRLSASARDRLSRLRRSGSARVGIPSDGWLLSRDRALAKILAPEALRAVVRRLNGHDSWSRFLFHLASTTPSGDFDPAVALFDECASPLWSMRALIERFERFRSGLPSELSLTALSQLIHRVERDRNLVLAGLFLPVYTARAIVHNELEAWCGVFERLAREGHAFINSPSTRLVLEREPVDSNCLQIAAGLGFGISCILPLITEG
jgi:hypothetical protein